MLACNSVLLVAKTAALAALWFLMVTISSLVALMMDLVWARDLLEISRELVQACNSAWLAARAFLPTSTS